MRGRSSRGVWIGAGLLAGVVLVILQISVVPWLSIKGVYPNVLVAVTVAVGLHFGPWEGVGLGAVLGALVDVLLGHPAGFLMVPLGLAGYASGLAHRRVLESRVLVPFGMGVVAAWLDLLAQFAVATMWGYGGRWTVAQMRWAFFYALFTGALAWGFFLLLLPVHRLQRQERLRVM